VATAHTIAVTVSFAIITAAEIIFGELTPKWIALERPETTALWLMPPLEVFMRTLWPFIRLVHGTARAVTRALGLKGTDSRAMVHSEEELKMLVTASQEAGVLEEQEEQMLHRVFGFADLTAGQVMLPRTELLTVSAGTTLHEVAERLGQSRDARIVVYRAGMDDVVGILQLTDLARGLASNDSRITASAAAREALSVPETLNADDLLAQMRRRKAREALVIDEYGGTAGLVTLESLVERIVGEVPGANESSRIQVRDDGSADVDGLALVTDVNEQFGLHIDADTYTTVGGFVLGALGRRARVGDVVDIEGRTIRVDQLDGLRVARIGISLPGPR
jgi:CBS domain containing-hemolysin-like protein